MSTKSLFLIIFFLSLHSTVFSKLSAKQKSSMISLFKHIQYQLDFKYDYTPWDVNADPCSWGPVICNEGAEGAISVTTLYLSHLNLYNSSFISIACQIDSLEVLDVSYNKLTSIPDEFATNCGKLPRLTEIDFSGNKISGDLPAFNEGFSKLESLNLSSNSLSGSIERQLDGLVALISLDLTSNNFTGSIPASLGKAKGLEYLALSHNNLQGRIPQQLASCKNLTILNLSSNKLAGNIPQSIGKLNKLIELQLGKNHLSGVSGSIPLSMSELIQLEYLNLEDNYLSGAIPNIFGDMYDLAKLQLGNNNLSGEIPPMPQCLQTLDLSNNILEGHIPPYISELKYLVSLDLSNNRISGAITHFSKDVLQSELFMSLSSLNLSYNLLSGPIPLILQNFKKEAFIGNLHLCGKPLTVNCHESIDKGLYVSIGLGFYLGFWGVCGTLVLKDAWRHALFNFVDNIHNNIYVTVAIYVARFKRNAQT